MSNSINRRKFFRKAGGTLMAGGAVAYGSGVGEARSKKRSTPVKGVDYYAKLGVTPFINAAGTFTVLSASILPDEVQAAMDLRRAAAREHRGAAHGGRRVPGEASCSCEAALVTAGAASALTLGTAACVTLGNRPGDRQSADRHVGAEERGHRSEDPSLRLRPRPPQLRHQVRRRSKRWHEYEAAFNERTVMAHFFNAAESGQISREDWVRVAHKHGVPCFNDAAADVPPISNLWNYTQMGFDLVTFSGGKGIRGPQCTGLLLGRKDLIEFAVKNNSPYSQYRRSRHEGWKGRDRRHGRRRGLVPEPGRGGHAGGVPAPRGKNRRPGEGYSHRRDQDLRSSRRQPRSALAG